MGAGGLEPAGEMRVVEAGLAEFAEHVAHVAPDAEGEERIGLARGKADGGVRTEAEQPVGDAPHAPGR